MTKNSITKPDVPVFIKLLDRGFNLVVPADEERFYRTGFDVFMHKVDHYKSKGNSYDDIEAIALASIDCLVTLQKNLEVMEELTQVFQKGVNRLDGTITKAMEN